MSLSSKVFDHKHPFTIGVEEEYMLCDPETGELTERAEVILNAIPEEMEARVSYELIQTEIEVNTDICKTVKEATAYITKLRRMIRSLGEEHGFRIGISGTHPTARPLEQKFVSAPGYQWVAQQLGYYAKRNITFATHVHIAVPDAKSAIHLTNALRRWIGPLLAVSTNSPFFEGVETGILSSRCFQFGTFPRTGIPATFRTFEEYENLVTRLIEMGSIEKPRQIWWKIRPSMDFGTIEFRMFDIQRSLKRTEMLIALSQALIIRSYRDFLDGTLVEDMSMDYLEDDLWKAIRFGLDVPCTDPVTMEVISMREFICKMADYVSDVLTELGNEEALDTLDDILETGPESVIQKKIFYEKGMSGLLQFLMDDVDFGE